MPLPPPPLPFLPLPHLLFPEERRRGGTVTGPVRPCLLPFAVKTFGTPLTPPPPRRRRHQSGMTHKRGVGQPDPVAQTRSSRHACLSLQASPLIWSGQKRHIQWGGRKEGMHKSLPSCDTEPHLKRGSRLGGARSRERGPLFGQGDETLSRHRGTLMHRLLPNAG